MIFKFKKQYTALLAFMILGCADARVNLQLGLSGSWALFFQKVKVKGRLPSINNKLHGNSVLAKFGQWDGSARHNQMAYRYQKNASNIKKYDASAESKADPFMASFIVLRELARRDNDPRTTGMSGPALTGARNIAFFHLNQQGLLNTGVQDPKLRCDPFVQVAFTDGQPAAVQAFFRNPALDVVGPGGRLAAINAVTTAARFPPEVQKQMAKKALEIAEKRAGKGVFTLNAAQNGLDYPNIAAPGTPQHARDVAAAFAACDFVECYAEGFRGMNMNPGTPGFDQSMRDQYIKTLMVLANENDLNEAGLLCEDIDGEFDVQTKGFLGAMDFAGHINAIYEMNDSVGLGVAISLGYSCRDMDLKNTPVNIKEGLFIQIGLVMAFNDWIQLHCGLGGAKRTIGLNKYEGWNSDYDAAKKIIANPALTSMLNVGRSNQALDPDDTLDHIALYAYAGVNLLFPIGDGLKLFVGISGQTDLNKCTGELGGAGEVEVGGMMSGKISVGVMFEL